MLDWLFITASFFLFLYTLYDIGMTVLSHSGAGPITKWWTNNIWRFVLYSKYKWNTNFFLKISGPFFVIGIIGVWYLLHYLCWFLFIYFGDHSIESKTDSLVSALDTIYYVGSAFSTLGLGEYKPHGFPWTLITTMGAFIVSLLVSFSISYLIPVLSALVDRRTLISKINLIGSDAQSIIESAWSGHDANSIDSEILDMVDYILKESYRTHVYPIINFFFHDIENASLNLNLLRLYDAIVVQDLKPERKGNLPAAKRKLFLNAIDSYIKHSFKNKKVTVSTDNVDHDEFKDLLRNFELQEKTLSKKDLDKVMESREKLFLLAHYEGYYSLR